jgi:hypothetical protein
MINKILPDVDPDIYVYETKLNFAQEFGRKLLSAVNSDITQFPKRHNYETLENPKEMIRRVGKDKTRELYNRYHQFLNLWPNQNRISFDQLFFTGELKAELIDIIPDWLKTFAGGPDFMLQVGQGGDILYPHKGHRRTCSLFMLLQSDDQETRWYRNTEDFEVIDPLRIPDMSKVEHVVSAVMQPYKWYVFNHREWHSVHKYSSNQKRINMGIDFNDVDPVELVNLIKQHGY